MTTRAALCEIWNRVGHPLTTVKYKIIKITHTTNLVTNLVSRGAYRLEIISAVFNNYYGPVIASAQLSNRFVQSGKYGGPGGRAKRL